VKKVELILLKNNKTYTTEFIFKTRGGSKSPMMFLFKLGTHLITPFEFSKNWKYKDLNQTLNLLFYAFYHDKLEFLIPNQNPFLKMIPKDSQNGIQYHQQIILGFQDE
jgi:hypothetical protein